MRILVLSDSHGNVENMARCVELTEPDVILHLGDCQRDAEALHRQFLSLPMQSVPGNCDWGAVDAPEVLTEYGGVRILMMHGHTRNIKASTLSAVYAAREMGAQVLLFGHTHRPLCQQLEDGLWMLNPGTARTTYGVIELDRGHIHCSLRQMP